MSDLSDILTDPLRQEGVYYGRRWWAEYGQIAAGWVDEPTPVNVLVPYSQRDARWAQEEYAGGTTFAKAGCLVTCIAMIASLAYAESLTPPEVAYQLRHAGAFNGNLLSNPSRIPVAFERLQWGGVVHWRDKAADMALLAREIAQYGATIAEVKWDPRGPMPQNNNQHFVVVEALDDDDAALVDPWDGARKMLSQTRYRLEGWAARRTLYGLRLVRPVIGS